MINRRVLYSMNMCSLVLSVANQPLTVIGRKKSLVKSSIQNGRHNAERAVIHNRQNEA